MTKGTPLVIIGAGGMGRETLDVVLAQNAASETPVHEVLGIVDSHPSIRNLQRLKALGVDYLGDEQEWFNSGRNADFIVGIGNPSIRRDVSLLFEGRGHRAALAVHPSAVLGSLTSLGRGTVICAGVQISTNVSLGQHVHVNPNVTVGHDARVGDFVSLNPGSILSGEVRCESGALIGAGAVVLQNLQVGRFSTVGAAACVTRDVPPHAVVKGVPALEAENPQ